MIIKIIYPQVEIETEVISLWPDVDVEITQKIIRNALPKDDPNRITHYSIQLNTNQVSDFIKGIIDAALESENLFASYNESLRYDNISYKINDEALELDEVTFLEDKGFE